MSEQKRVILKVDRERKAKWDECAPEHFRNVSLLVRVAGEKEIADTHQDTGLPDDLPQTLSDLTDGIGEVTTRIDTYRADW